MTRQVEKAYLDELSGLLRMHGLEADQIGDILAEVETHVSMTGEPAREAFGPPAQYARMWAPQVDQSGRRVNRWSRAGLVALIPAAGIMGFLLFDFAFELIHGTGVFSTGWRWGLLLAFMVILQVANAKNLIDPLTGRHPTAFAREWLVGVVFGAVAVASMIGLYMSALGAFTLGYGSGPFAAAIDVGVGVGHWWLLGLGLPLAVTGATVLPTMYTVSITDPRSGQPFGPSRRGQVLTLAAVAIVSPLAFFGLGFLLR